MLVTLILVMVMSAPRSTIHQWLVSGAVQKQESSVSSPSTASLAVCSAWLLLAEAAGTGEAHSENQH